MTHRLWCAPQRLTNATITLMGELELVARVDNRLLLRDAAGAEYRLPICSKLKSAVYSVQSAPLYSTVSQRNAIGREADVKAEANLAKVGAAVPAEAKNTVLSVVKDVVPDGEPQPRLRPAELQIRLRAGDTPEQLAEFSDLTAAQISRFAGPIEAERADIIRAMGRIQLAGSGVPGSVGSSLVGDLINQRLCARGINSKQMAWFARREIGAPWLIELKFEDGGRPHSARWTFDFARNHLTALDDEARWLSSPDTPITEAVPISLHSAKRPTAVKSGRNTGPHSSVFELPDSPQVSGAPLRMPQRGTERSAEGMPDAVTTPRKSRPDLRAVSDSPAEAVVETPVEAKKEDVAGIVPLSHWKSEKLETVALPVTPASGEAQTLPSVTDALLGRATGGSHNAGKGNTKSNPAEVLFESTATGSNPTVGRKKGRAKIPSWDEIVFGAKE